MAIPLSGKAQIRNLLKLPSQWEPTSQRPRKRLMGQLKAVRKTMYSLPIQKEMLIFLKREFFNRPIIKTSKTEVYGMLHDSGDIALVWLDVHEDKKFFSLKIRAKNTGKTLDLLRFLSQNYSEFEKKEK